MAQTKISEIKMMTKWIDYCLTAIWFLTCCSIARADGVWLTDLNEARKIAAETNRPILCHFYADWCGPCQQMEKQVFPAPQVQQQLRNSVVAVKINAQTQKFLSHRFGVATLPTDIILEPNGDEILQSSGFRTQSEYLSLVTRAQTRYADLLASRAAEPRRPEVNVLEDAAETIKPAAISKVMLDGFCPVSLWKSRRWEKGSLQYQVDFKGQRYHFASAEQLAEFHQSPERYVPQFLGCDPVVVWESDRAVSGDIQYGAFYDERLYLFTTEANRKRFKASPDRFIKTQVVLHVDQIEKTVK